MDWRSCPIEAASLLYFDLETTGLRADRGARITEIAVVGPQAVRLDWTCAAGRGTGSEAGSEGEAGDAQPNTETPNADTPSDETPSDEAVAEQIPRLVSLLGSGVVVGHNLAFDFRFLSHEAERLHGPRLRLDVRYVDTLTLARRLLDLPSYQLSRVLDATGDPPQETLHTALGDALATRTLFRRLRRHDTITTLSDAGLQRLAW